MIGGDESVFAAAMSGEEMPETGTLENLAQETEPVETPAPVVEPAPTPKPPDPDTADAIPAWRLREEATRRRELEAEAAELRQFKAQVEKERQEAEKAKAKPEFWGEPEEFVQDRAREVVDPLAKQLEETRTLMQQQREFYSRREAEREHGKEKVEEAYKALDAAINTGEIDRSAVLSSLQSSLDPFGEIVTWHKRYSLQKEIGNDPEAYRKRLREDALKDPEFLAAAVEAARAQATPVISGSPARPGNVTPLPSLNRTPAAARDDDEAEDAVEVFNTALNGRRG